MITTSKQITDDLAAQVAASSGELRAFLEHVGAVAGPEQGWVKLLKIFAVASKADWLEGDLQVDLVGESEGTALSLYSVLGMGIRERLFGQIWIAVPIDEFQRALVLNPALAAPLRPDQGVGRLTLAAGARVRPKDLPEFEVEEMALGDGERITAPPPTPDPEEEVHTRSTAPPPRSYKPVSS